jgi:hypothetical protein
MHPCYADGYSQILKNFNMAHSIVSEEDCNASNSGEWNLHGLAFNAEKEREFVKTAPTNLSQ